MPTYFCDEAEWSLSAADIDLPDGVDRAASFPAPDTRDAVDEWWHTAQITHVNVLDAVNAWDRADDHLLDGARNATAWLRHRLRISHGHAGTILLRARGLRDTPRIREGLLCGELSVDQVDQLLHVFTPARRAYVARDVEMLIDHVGSMPIADAGLSPSTGRPVSMPKSPQTAMIPSHRRSSGQFPNFVSGRSSTVTR